MTYSSGDPSGREPTMGTARERAAEVRHGTAQAGGQVAKSAMEQGKQVAGETRQQVRNLMDQASTEVRDQAGTQQHRAAEGLHHLSDELSSMSRTGDHSGMAADLVNQASQGAKQLGDWLDRREPGQLLDEVRDFARRRPGTFLAAAGVAGVLVGRLTRSAVAERGEPSTDMRAQPQPSAPAMQPPMPGVGR